MKTSYNTLSEAITDYLQKGYTVDFNLEQNRLSSKSEQQKAAEELTVVKFYRFEGKSNPSDNCILYVIEAADGKKGLLVDSYGTQTGSVSPEIIQKLKIDVQ